MIWESRGDSATQHELDALLERATIELASVTVEHMEAARGAWRRFGKGNHRTALNYAYALAKITGEPLLFKGKDL